MLCESPLPIVSAPMAGGPTTVALSRVVAAAGGFPFLAGGYQTASALEHQIKQLRTATNAPFGVNLFVPNRDQPNAEAIAAYAAALQPDADRYQLHLDPTLISDDDSWEQKLELLVTNPVPVVSFTFGLPSRTEIARLQVACTTVLATVTTASEANAAAERGVNGLVAQGPRAGGHSATHDPFRTPELIETADLARHIRMRVHLPVIAAGGVDGAAAVRTILDAGAEAVAIGTLLLRTDEAGTSATHRAALADPNFTETVISRAFTGRPARALRNAFIDQHETGAPTAYPAVHHLTRALRQAASTAGDPHRLHLWAGAGYRQARTGSATEIVRELSEML